MTHSIQRDKRKKKLLTFQLCESEQSLTDDEWIFVAKKKIIPSKTQLVYSLLKYFIYNWFWWLSYTNSIVINKILLKGPINNSDCFPHWSTLQTQTISSQVKSMEAVNYHERRKLDWVHRITNLYSTDSVVKSYMHRWRSMRCKTEQ